MTDTPNAPAGQATTFLTTQSDQDKSGYEVRDAFLARLAELDMKAVIFELDGEMGENADLVVFADGTGFFASTDSGSYLPWPYEMAYGDQQFDETELLPPLGDLSAIDFEKHNGEVFSRADLCDMPAVEEWVRRLANDLPDPPEALRDLVVATTQEFYWEDRGGQDRAQTLIAQFAQVYVGAECTIMIRSHYDAGRPPVQKRNDARMFEQMKGYTGFGSDYEREAMYGGHAYAEIESTTAMDWQALSKINAALAWFSMKVLERLGRPVGWETDYNDNARDRMSGYSANADAIEIELTDVLSNHERMSASMDIAAFLAEIDEAEAFEDVRKECKLSALATPGTGA